MGGHLFVLRGDLTKLHCSAVLIPCDSKWRVVAEHWAHFLPKDSLTEPNGAGWAGYRHGGVGRLADVVTTGDKWIHLVVTADAHGVHGGPESTASWIADGVFEAIRALEGRELPLPAGRVKKLVGLPLVGTGDGGFRFARGVLIRALIPALQNAAREYDIDIALVLREERDHAAVQAVRKDYWADFVKDEPDVAEYLDAADRLGREAARGQLSLFLGSGVSVPLGVPDWEELLTEAAGGREIKDFDPKNAPAIAQNIEELWGRPAIDKVIEDKVNIAGVAPTHLLLSALSVRQAVTTNYDTAYEEALTTAFGSRGYRVLAKQLAKQPQPWLMKLHGCVTNPDTIVITTDDYTNLHLHHSAMESVVEALLLTSHLMFVGFSMGDPSFVEAAKRVQAVRALAEGTRPSKVATVLALGPGAVEEHDDFEVVYMLDGNDTGQAARRLEIFLDRVSWVAATEGPSSCSYLLDPAYADLFSEEESTRELRRQLGQLVAEVGVRNPMWSTHGWKQVADLLAQLGDKRFDDDKSLPNSPMGTTSSTPSRYRGPDRVF